MNSVKAITKNVVSLTLMNIVTIVAILILNIFITRSLGDENFGKYSFAIAFTAIFGIIIPLGMDKLIIRDIARDPEKTGKYFSSELTEDSTTTYICRTGKKIYLSLNNI